MPTLRVDAAVLSVGQTKEHYMDAPKGPPDDPVWQDAFWYRGGARPGAPGTATIAAHVDDSRGRPGPFAHLGEVRVGDSVDVVDIDHPSIAHFRVTETRVYTLRDATSQPVLERLFGRSAVTNREADRASEAAAGIAHLTLITCAGEFVNGEFDKRLAVYAVRV